MVVLISLHIIGGTFEKPHQQFTSVYSCIVTSAFLCGMAIFVWMLINVI